MKIGVSTFSYMELINKNILTQLSCIETSKQIGFDGIEFAKIIPHDNSSKESYAEKLAKECSRLSMPVINYAFGADFINGSDGDIKKEIEKVKHEIDIAQILGAKFVRHDCCTGYKNGIKKGFDNALPYIVEACEEIAEYGKNKGIKTTMENHGHFCEDSDRIEKIMTNVKNENFGLLCDMANFMWVDENPATAIGKLSNFIFYVHAKDFIFKSGNEFNPGKGFAKSRSGNYLRRTIIGHGNLPLLQCINTLKNNNYEDFISIEYGGMEDNLEGLKISYENLKKCINYVY